MRYTPAQWKCVCLLTGLSLLWQPAWGDPSPNPVATPSAGDAAAVSTAGASPLPGHCLIGTLPNIDTVQLEKDLIKLRGLPFKQAVPVSAKHQDELHAMLQAGAHSNEEQENTASATLAAFGFVEPHFDLGGTTSKLTENILSGFYEFKSKQFFLCVDNIRPPAGLNGELFAKVGFTSEMMVSTHELDHALQDQYFDLTKMHEAMRHYDNSDRYLATKALIEGEANWVMYAALFERMGQPPTAMPNLTRLQENAESSRPLYRAGTIPMYLRRTMFFPYIEGVGFVHELRRLGLGWDIVNKTWLDPPDSTQQILHPFLYVGERQFPTSVTWNTLPASFGDWKQVDQDVMGEYESTVLFDTLGGEAPVHRAVAAGWLGDHYRTYTNADRVAVFWYSSWKDEATAGEVAKLMDTAWGGRRFSGLPWHVERLGQDVLAVRGLTLDEFNTVKDQARDVTKKVESHPVLVHLSEADIYDRETQASKVKIDAKKMAALLPPIQSAHDYKQESGRYSSATIGFSIGTDGWTITTNDVQGHTVAVGRPTDGSAAGLSIASIAVPTESVSLVQLGEGVEQGVEKTMQEYHHLSSEDMTLHGISAHQFDLTGVSKGTQQLLRGRVYVVATRHGVVIVSFMAPPPAWDKAQALVERTIQSLQLQ